MEYELTFTVLPARDGQRLETVLRSELGLSKSRLQSLKWTPGALLRNGAPVRAADPVRAGDRITAYLPEKPAPAAIPARAGTLDLRYEDEALLVICKRAGVSMHSKGDPDCLAAALLAHLGEGAALHFVNRLDKGTSGLLLAAKRGHVHELLRRSLHTGDLVREYRALSLGTPSPERGRVALPIGPDEERFYARRVRPDGQRAVTDYAVLERRGDLALLRLLPETGRTHQLRLHMSALGCPLLGDALYGAPPDPRLDRPALHSFRLRLTHPLTGERLQWEASLPEDMAEAWKAAGRK